MLCVRVRVAYLELLIMKAQRVLDCLLKMSVMSVLSCSQETFVVCSRAATQLSSTLKALRGCGA